MMSMTIGKPYGIQLGSLHIGSDFFPKEFRNKQDLDVLLVAHGMAHIKPAVHWTQDDIDSVLLLGTELHRETRTFRIDKLGQLTKGFTLKKDFIQVTMSEPIVVGKVMTVTDRSMDLISGLEKFFSQHKNGILQTTDLDLYIAKRQAYFVFDPRGRTLECQRSSQGEAAMMALWKLKNVYHLIVNLSKINIKGPFKISSVEVTQFMSSRNSPEKFTAVSGNPSRHCRSDDYKILENQIAYVRGSLHLGSKVFGSCGGKQHLTTGIMAMVYSKIDPPSSWSSAIVDRVLHFGSKMFSDCLEDGPSRNLTLVDIPSKFYVGEFYRVGIKIAPFLHRLKLLKPTRIFCDDPIVKVLRSLFGMSPFQCLLLQIDNNTYATWQMKSSEVFYFFDAQQKDINGSIDRSQGTSCLFMLGTIDKLCEVVVKRLMMIPRSSESFLVIHGLKIIELSKLSEKEEKCKPKFRMAKIDCIRPMTEEAAEVFEDSPSTVDSVAPVLTASVIRKLREEISEKPSLVCCQAKLNEDIMSSLDEKQSFVERSDFSRETIALVLCIHSEMLLNAIGSESTEDIEINTRTDRKSCS